MTLSVTEVRGIGASTAETLKKHGFKTVANLAIATVAQLTAIPGFSQSRATSTIESAKALLDTDPAQVPEQDEAVEVITEKREKNKDRKQKSGKKSKKDKKKKKKKKKKK